MFFHELYKSGDPCVSQSDYDYVCLCSFCGLMPHGSIYIVIPSEETLLYHGNKLPCAEELELFFTRIYANAMTAQELRERVRHMYSIPKLTTLCSSFILHTVTYTHLQGDRNGAEWWIVMPHPDLSKHLSFSCALEDKTTQGTCPSYCQFSLLQ